MPKDSISREEFNKRKDGFDEKVRRVIEERLRTNYRRERYEFLAGDEPAILGAILDRLIPQDGPGDRIDLVGFMDWAIPHPMGYGHRREGMPDQSTLFREGIKGVNQTAEGMFAGRGFAELSDGDKDQVLRAVQEGSAEGDVWKSIPSGYFFKQLMQKAIAGYCAHPRTWMRIGFYGPSYPEGYVWVSTSGAQARRAKRKGYLTF